MDEGLGSGRGRGLRRAGSDKDFKKRAQAAIARLVSFAPLPSLCSAFPLPPRVSMSPSLVPRTEGRGRP